VFSDSFPLIRKCRRNYLPEVVYPSIDERSFQKTAGFSQSIDELIGKRVDKEKTVILTSLNRYERKKNIPLALQSFAYYVKNGLKNANQGVQPLLVIAGGYDPRL
jgi:alpha-1,3/alpha-1,6-mannosyltransferase